ncbi:hypothetical protein PENVUL_c017G06132 [Penicillium vulpinum]|uniref:Uncharacterized protein n=1 Tax=Penicillium vulpinum TaxID=29845 RepID=A0A1V6RYP7_9EURO|nr:hypothetical protein PENVUL_c017G06132 [Penicillium vulpinum]
MNTQRPHRPARFARKCGPTFSTLDHLSNASLCSHEMGRVQIDCRFRLSKTQWGVLGGGNTPAAVLYMDLTFDQPKDCQLTSAVVAITMEESDIEPHRERKQTVSRTRPRLRHPTQDSDHGLAEDSTGYLAPATVDTVSDLTTRSRRCLQVTPYYGPHELAGKPTQVTIKETQRFTPEINVLGQGGGGVGYDHEKSIEQTSQWTFTGKVLSGTQSQHTYSAIGSSRPRRNHRRPNPEPSVYRTMKWELNEDDNQAQSQHSSVIHTAFAFEHDMEPFYIRIDIQGKLQRRSEQFKGNMKQLFRFPSKTKKDQGTALIRVYPDKTTNQTRRLDRIAQGLSLSMERLNMENIRVQLPDSMPISFQQDTPQAFDDLAPALEEMVEDEPRSNDHQPSAAMLAHRSPKMIPSSSHRGRTTSIPTSAGDVEMMASSWPSGSSTLNGSNTGDIMSQCLPPLNETQQNSEIRGEISRTQTMATSKSVNVSRKHTGNDLEDLASQLSQFPTLLLIFQWAIWMFSFSPRTIAKAAQKRGNP